MKLRISIRAAILSIVCIASIVMSALIGISVYAQHLRDDLRADVKRIESLSLTFSQLKVEFLMARRAEKDFLLRREEKYVDRHAATMQSLLAELATAEAMLVPTDGLQAEQFETLRQKISAYQGGFALLVGAHRRLGLDEKTGLQGALRRAVHDVETRLQELDRPEMQVKMLMMRRHEKDFIMRGKVKYLDRLNARVEEFRAFPPAYYANSQQQVQILGLMAEYQKSFAEYVSEALAEQEMRKGLSRSFAEAEPIMNALSEKTRKAMQEIMTATTAAEQEAQKRFLIAGITGIVLFTLVALRLSFGIARPLRDVSVALKNMAVGDYSETLRHSRISEIASITDVAEGVRKNQQAKDRLTRDVNSVIAACARGDFSQRLDVGSGKDSFADLCRGVNAIGDAAQQGLGNVRAALDRLAAGDLTQSMPEGQKGVFKEISDGVDILSDNLRAMVRQLSDSGGKLNDTSREIASSVDGTSHRMENSAAALEKTSGALKLLNETVRETAESATRASDHVAEVQRNARITQDVANKTVAAMSQIETSSAKITKVTDVIEDMAFQTNLLALNAGGEAARAGEAGRGFAVVASEVRDLAKRSSDAVQEINDLIKSSTHEVETGVHLIGETDASLTSIRQAVERVADQVNNIAEAATEQSSGLSEINDRLSNLDEDAQKNAVMLEETVASGQFLKDEAEALVDAVGGFKLIHGDATPGKMSSPAVHPDAGGPANGGYAAVDRIANAG